MDCSFKQESEKSKTEYIQIIGDRITVSTVDELKQILDFINNMEDPILAKMKKRMADRT